MAPPQWVAFAGLTGLVLFGFLTLAFLSQGRVSGDDSSRSGDTATDPPDRDTAAGSQRSATATAFPEGDTTAESRANDTPTGDAPADADRQSVSTTPSGVDPAVDDDPANATLPASTVEFDSPAQGDLASLPTSALLVNVALTQGLFAAALVGGAIAFAIPADAFGFESLLSDLLGPPMAWGIGLGIALWALSELGGRLTDAAGIEHDESLRELLAPDSLGGWVLLLGGVLPVIAGVEELVFRAAAIGALSVGLGISPWTLAVVSSFVFALGHGAQGPAGLVITGLLGFVLATAFILTGSFLTVVVAHYLVNAIEFLVHEGLG